MVFFGSDSFSAITLTHLLDAGYSVPLVISSARRQKGRGGRDQSHPVLDLAAKHSLSTLTPGRFDSETINSINKHGCQAAVLSSYGKILPSAVLELFPTGIINVHPSLLPRWRGPSPIEAAILAGDKETGVSLMRLDSKMDSGPIFVQEKYRLKGDETQGQLYEALAHFGGALLEKELSNIVNDTTKARPQANTGITYSRIINKSDGAIDWTQTADHIERQIRAYSLWPKCRTSLFGKDVIVTQAKVSHEVPIDYALPRGSIIPDKKRLLVKTGTGYLEVTQLKPSGKAEMTGVSFLSGYASASS